MSAGHMVWKDKRIPVPVIAEIARTIREEREEDDD